MAGVRPPAEARNFSLLHGMQTGSEDHVASYPIFLPGVKRPELESDHSPLCSAEVKNAWSCTSTTPYLITLWCLIQVRGNFTLAGFEVLTRVVMKSRPTVGPCCHHFESRRLSETRNQQAESKVTSTRVVSFISRPLYFREKDPGTRLIWKWMGSVTGLDNMEKRNISCCSWKSSRRWRKIFNDGSKNCILIIQIVSDVLFGWSFLSG
jgi:hypothetical protein